MSIQDTSPVQETGAAETTSEDTEYSNPLDNIYDSVETSEVGKTTLEGANYSADTAEDLKDTPGPVKNAVYSNYISYPQTTGSREFIEETKSDASHDTPPGYENLQVNEAAAGLDNKAFAWVPVQMSGHLQPKQLSELAVSRFTAQVEMKARELIKMSKEKTSPEAVTEIYKELENFFHGTKLPPLFANELTQSILIKLNEIFEDANYDGNYWIDTDYERMVLRFVEIFMHPDVTELRLGPKFVQGFDVCLCDLPRDEIANAILTNIHNLPKLKTFNLRFDFYDTTDKEIVLPSKITDFTLSNYHDFDNKVTIGLDSCPELKNLKVRSCVISPESILKCKHLETLHLVDTTLKDEDIVNLINTISSDTTASTITSLGITLQEENTLFMIVDKLLSLTEITLNFGKHVDLSSLTLLKNLKFLSLIPNFDNTERYKDILSTLGKNLEYLCINRNRSLDLEFIGDTCTKLKSLHLNGLCRQDLLPSFKTFPNFKTVECLELDLRFNPVWSECIVDQCLNVKELYVISCWSLQSIVTKVIHRTPANSLRQIHWWTGENMTDISVMDELRSTYPGLIVHAHPTHSDERLAFYLNGSPHNVCKVIPHYSSGILY